jgi:ABC-type glycerol-3-phosphate transport system substrate-binding protein
MKGMSRFQLIFTGMFAGFLVLGVIVFAMQKGASSTQTTPITVWGYMSDSNFTKLLEQTKLLSDRVTPVTYVQKDPSTFEQDFLEAVADGAGPDVVMISQEQFYKEKNKLLPIPYATLDQRTFKDTYIQEAELFMLPEGIYAVPFSIDPYVMYWNRTIFQNAGLSQPPQYWDEFYNLAKVLTKKDGALNITQSAVGLGEYSNIAHAKELLSTLIMQAGSSITKLDPSTGKVSSVFDERFNDTMAPSEAAIDFYTQFSDPTKAAYSWNRSLPNSKDMFISGDLTTYFGPASELFEIQAKNPNLNFDVAYIPQSRDTKDKITFGNLEGLAIVKTSKHPAAAYKVISLLTGRDVLTTVSTMTLMPPVRRDLLASKPTTAYGSIFYNSAIFAAGWIDPNETETDTIFSNMIGSITAGRAQSGEAVGIASAAIEQLLNTAPKAPAPVSTSGTSGTPL